MSRRMTVLFAGTGARLYHGNQEMNGVLLLRILLWTILSLVISVGYAQETIQPLPPEQAFVFKAHLDQSNQLILQWFIAPGYYLYRDHLKITSAPENKVKLGQITLPPGVEKQDTVRGFYQIYSGELKVPVSLQDVKKGPLDLRIAYQGCSLQGFCYSPLNKLLQVDLADLPAPRDLTQNLVTVRALSASPLSDISDQDYAERLFTGHNVYIVVLSFLGLGVLLGFTPCVLPMVPILSGIIMGQRNKKLTMRTTFSLSLAYVLGMAITYAIAGMIIALIGSRIQTELQRPWIILLFSGILILLALSLFGVFQLQIPARWQKQLTTWSNRQKGGTYLGVFVMGSISSLIVSPCVSPPLVGVLAYIAQTGNVWLGASALLALGLGMGFPLLLIGASAGKLLPKVGPWMLTLERAMGVMLLAFAIWMLSRILFGPITLFLWAVLLIGCAIYLSGRDRGRNDKQSIWRGVAAIGFIYGVILLVGAALGGSDPFHPLENWQFHSAKIVNTTTKNTLTTALKNMPQVQRELSRAKQQKKPVMIDFYADWCVSCISMERNVLSQPEVQEALSAFVLLRADITENNDFDQALQRRFHVIAPPTFLFFDANGNELAGEKIIGEASAAKFLQHLTRIMEKEPNRAN